MTTSDLAEVGDVASPPAVGRSWPLTPGASLGQTVRPRHAGLCAVEFMVEVMAGFTGVLVCHVQTADREIEHRVALPGSTLDNNRYARFPIPPLAAAGGRPLYTWLETDAPGLGVYTTGPTGGVGAWRDHVPVATSLVFRSYAVAPDARVADREVVEHLLARQADLTREVIGLRTALQRLIDERTAVERRLDGLAARLRAATVDVDHD